MKASYERPTVKDLGSIADHTFTTCNPDGAVLPPGHSHIPPKGPSAGNWHYDKFQECSSLS